MSEEGIFWVDEETQELVLQDEQDEQRFYIDEEINMNSQKYLILIPSENTDEYSDNEALILKLKKEEKGEVISIIEDDKEFEMVKEQYQSH